MKYVVWMLAVAIGAVSVSCRSIVFESRSDCPQYIFIDVLNDALFDSRAEVSVGVSRSRGGVVEEKDTTTLADIRGRRFYVTGHGNQTVSVCGVVGYGGSRLDEGSRWTVGAGREYPALFRFEGSVRDPEDGAVVSVELLKEYCCVTVLFSGYRQEDVRDGLCPFTVTVSGNSCGIDAMTGVPVYGWYEFSPLEVAEGLFRFRVPRQLDESLSMRVGLKDGVSGYGAVARELSLWNRFRLLGNVTWEEKNLPDVELDIDVSVPTYRIAVSAWQEDGAESDADKDL